MKRTAAFVLSCLLFISVQAVSIAQVLVVPPPGVNTAQVVVDYHRVTINVDNRIATTTVEMQFTNTGEALAEGQFIFPLPPGAAVEQLLMIVNGQSIEAQILRAAEARATYDAIVRQYRDPALLEYIGRDLLQANVFPIPAGEKRQIKITYGQALTADNGLVKVSYPLKAPVSLVPQVSQLSVRVEVTSAEAIGNIYSPTHPIALSRRGSSGFVAGFEQSFASPESDFVLYYGVQGDVLDANLMTYKASADEDGFFMMMIQPPSSLGTAQIQPKDVVVVLDQSGSMEGEKWAQAQAAAVYVLENLNEGDRFNVVPFSTSVSIYANEMQPLSQAADAVRWVRSLFPGGGTNIHDALKQALSFASERPLTVIFMTDGLATEGIAYTPDLLASLTKDAPPNARIFTFGVGDDVDTVLLDSLVRDFRGTGSYVRPYERIDEEVASLYNKISAPVMNDVSLAFEGVIAELMYPQQLPDLFAGEQLILVGRYRSAAEDAAIVLTGVQGSETITIRYDSVEFRQNAGGEDFIARLWATRRIGDLLRTIRLRGEDKELVDSVVALSIRYGIITPYTSFLITEDDILSQQGREQAQAAFGEEAERMAASVTGAGAVSAADTSAGLANAAVPMPMATAAPTMMAAVGTATPSFGSAPGQAAANVVPAEPKVNPVKYAGGKTFILQGDVWMDTTYNPDTMTTTRIVFLSDAYFDFLEEYPEAAAYFAVGENVIVVINGQAIEVVAEGS
jgi:Ca-activated chloride channel family protein